MRQAEVSEDSSQQAAEWRAGPHWAQQLRSQGRRKAATSADGRKTSQRERFFQRRQSFQEGDREQDPSVKLGNFKNH